MSKLTKAAMALLAEVVAATKEGSFVYTNAKARKSLEAANLVEINQSVTDDEGNVATRATTEGITMAETTNTEGGTANAEVKAVAKPTVSSIVADVVMPSVRSGARSDVYPFATMEPGQSFFVPATEDKPNPAKSLASTVTSANLRYSEEIPDETRTNRRGREVPARRQLRDFALRTVADGGPWGYPGVAGAAVWRTK